MYKKAEKSRYIEFFILENLFIEFYYAIYY